MVETPSYALRIQKIPLPVVLRCGVNHEANLARASSVFSLVVRNQWPHWPSFLRSKIMIRALSITSMKLIRISMHTTPNISHDSAVYVVNGPSSSWSHYVRSAYNLRTITSESPTLEMAVVVESQTSTGNRQSNWVRRLRRNLKRPQPPLRRRRN